MLVGHSAVRRKGHVRRRVEESETRGRDPLLIPSQARDANCSAHLAGLCLEDESGARCGGTETEQGDDDERESAEAVVRHANLPSCGGRGAAPGNPAEPTPADWRRASKRSPIRHFGYHSAMLMVEHVA